MAGRPEGVAPHQAPGPCGNEEEVSAPRAAAPSVAFGDISPLEGEIRLAPQPRALNRDPKQRLPPALPLAA